VAIEVIQHAHHAVIVLSRLIGRAQSRLLVWEHQRERPHRIAVLLDRRHDPQDAPE
jgi:hypothetical protein